MYLTDYRERSLKDVITQLEPALFKKVTGLDVKDFDLLCSLGVFNANLMNDAIYKFKRYEDSSLSYTGIDKHAGEDVGLWDTVVKRTEYEALFTNQQSTMSAPTQAADDVPDEPYVFVPDEDEEAEEPAQPEKKAKKRDASVITYTVPVEKKEPVQQSSFVSEQFGVRRPAVPIAPKEAPKPTVDVSGVVVGATVHHGKFGDGTVIEIKGGFITVTFGKAEKKFQFPGAFEGGFLKI
ncbi:MAG: hypothetical protein PHC80_07955 [Eubacteriales bacterium]|nr:hypothetical protein [Eubacteriales bacterium]